jgi:flagellar export protein FliJ
MKSLQTLLKVAQRRMEELGVEATRTSQKIEQLRLQQAAIRAREDTEVQLAASDIKFAMTLHAYQMRARQQIEEIGRTIAADEALLADIRERLSAAYQEKSKFEQLIEREELRQAAERAERDQAALDEVAVNRAGFVGK